MPGRQRQLLAFAQEGRKPAAAPGQADQVVLPAQLLAGWNNVSYLGAAKPPSEALASIAGQYSAVYRWDSLSQSYQLYAPGVPGFANTLTQINPGDAIWVKYNQQQGELNTGSLGTAGSIRP